jgi:YD repeat-containing protein
MKHRTESERRPSRMVSAARPVLPVRCAVVMSLAAAQAVAQATSAGPMTWTYEYDANGNLTRVIDPVKAVTDRNLDSLAERAAEDDARFAELTAGRDSRPWRRLLC